MLVVSVAACASAGTVPKSGAELDSVERDMIVASIQVVTAGFRDTAAVCVELLGGPEGSFPPDDTLLGRIGGRQRAVAAAKCPATFTRISAPPNDTIGPPSPGYVDPHYVRIGRPQFERPGYAWLLLRLQQGTSGAIWVCSAQQSGNHPILASCRRSDGWLN